MKVAVTGATGFIGHHVTQRLAKENVDIVAVGRDKNKWNGLGEFIELDISTADNSIYDKLRRPDVLIHLAWGGLPNYRSLIHYENELPTQYAFLKSMIRGGLTNLSVAGTCFEYGMRNGSLSEGMIANPKNPYGLAKNTLRQQLEYLSAEMHFKFNWMRLFYLWGDDQSSNSLYPQLAKAVLDQEKSFNMSGGEQLRDYLHVSEVSDYLVRIALQSRAVGIVNICSGRPISVRRLVEDWIRTNDWNINLNLGYYNYPDYEPMAFWGSNEKLQMVLNDDK